MIREGQAVGFVGFDSVKKEKICAVKLNWKNFQKRKKAPANTRVPAQAEKAINSPTIHLWM